MRLTLYYISATLIVLFYASCNSHRSSKYTEKDIIAEFDGEVIYASEINTIIKQELYDELCRIHNIKKEALEQLINVKLLQKEANKKQLTYQTQESFYEPSEAPLSQVVNGVILIVLFIFSL